ncbi:MAG: hypothetical protein ACI83I_000429 [Bacteroidia bacterium]|jgi:uncharacterized protein YkuJ
MKPIQFIGLAILFVQCVSTETKCKDWEGVSLHGNIKKVTLLEYDPIEKFGKIQKGNLRFRTETIYSENGNKIESNIYYHTDTSLEYKMIYNYDSTGNLTDETHYQGNGDRASKIKYILNNDRFSIITKLNYHSDSSTSKTICEFDLNGNLTQTISFNKEDSLTRTFKMKYNEKGELVQTTRHNQLDSVDSKFLYRYDNYDAKNNWIKRTVYMDDQINLIEERRIKYQ